jgi:hypothetical protein
MLTKIYNHLPVRVVRGLVLLVALGGLAVPALADPPGRVGRLNYISGSVSIRTGDTEDWSEATLNYPLTTGDHLWADADSRAEIRLGTAAFRLAPQTAFCLLNLDDQTAQIQLTEGSLNVHIRGLDPDNVFEVDTPEGAISLLRPGDYRIDVTSEGATANVIVRGGEAEVTAEGQAFPIHPRQAAIITGGDSISYDIRPAPRQDGWDDWCVVRERRVEHVAAVRYVSDDTIGCEDLDAAGTWRVDASYGAFWVPTGIAVGWAPYRYGRWCWREAWGWNWVDDSPWGFAPFHYGRWAYAGGVWGWCPGALVGVGFHACYAPALVAFCGGGGWGVSLGFGVGGGVGWFALGPREPWYPGYACSSTYIHSVNITHVNVTNINVRNTTYINRNVPGACTGASHEAFCGGRSLGKSAVTVPPSKIGSAKFGSTAAVAPTKQSVLGGAGTGKSPPAGALSRQVVAKSTPPASPVPFSAKQKALAANPGQPLDSAKTAALRGSTKTASNGPNIKAATASSGKALKPARASIVAPHAATLSKTGNTGTGAGSGTGKNAGAGTGAGGSGTGKLGGTARGNTTLSGTGKGSGTGTGAGASGTGKNAGTGTGTGGTGKAGTTAGRPIGAGSTKPGPSGSTKPSSTILGKPSPKGTGKTSNSSSTGSSGNTGSTGGNKYKSGAGTGSSTGTGSGSTGTPRYRTGRATGSSGTGSSGTGSSGTGRSSSGTGTGTKTNPNAPKPHLVTPPGGKSSPPKAPMGKPSGPSKGSSSSSGKKPH